MPDVASAGELTNGGTHLELPLPRRGSSATSHATSRPPSTLPALDAPSAPPPATLPAGGAAAPASAPAARSTSMRSADSAVQRLLYLDYWWYLPYNPAGSGSGAFCGPGS